MQDDVNQNNRELNKVDRTKQEVGSTVHKL